MCKHLLHHRRPSGVVAARDELRHKTERSFQDLRRRIDLDDGYDLLHRYVVRGTLYDVLQTPYSK